MAEGAADATAARCNLLVEKLAEIVGSGHKVVIFSQFVMLLDRVRSALDDALSRTCRATRSPA